MEKWDGSSRRSPCNADTALSPGSTRTPERPTLRKPMSWWTSAPRPPHRTTCWTALAPASRPYAAPQAGPIATRRCAKRSRKPEAPCCTVPTFPWESICFLRSTKPLARLMAPYPQYHAEIEEVHHIHKLDAPSGTAITLAEGLLEHNPRYTGWTLETDTPAPQDQLPIRAIRQGEIPGIHTVRYTSPVDTPRDTARSLLPGRIRTWRRHSGRMDRRPPGDLLHARRFVHREVNVEKRQGTERGS